MSIVAICIIVLSIAPCCIVDNCPAEKINTGKNIQNQQSEHQSGDKDGCGGCSPFAICSTCPGLSFSVTTFCIVIASPPHISKLVFPIYNSTFSSAFVPNIWQPPKLVS